MKIHPKKIGFSVTNVRTGLMKTAQTIEGMGFINVICVQNLLVIKNEIFFQCDYNCCR